MNFVYQGQQNKVVSFLNPANTRHSLTLSHSASTERRSDGYKTIRTEIANRKVVAWSPVEGCEDKCSRVTETIPVRVLLSGSPENEAELIRRWTETKAIVDAAIANGALRGIVTQFNAEFAVLAEGVPAGG